MAVAAFLREKHEVNSTSKCNTLVVRSGKGLDTGSRIRHGLWSSCSPITAFGASHPFYTSGRHGDEKG